MAMKQEEIDYRITHLPSLEPSPMPWSIRREPWVRESKLEEILREYDFHGGKIPTHNGKLMPVSAAMKMDWECGRIYPGRIILGPTSGNAGIEGGLNAPAYGCEFRALINTKKVPPGKQCHLEAAGAKIEPLPGGVSAHDYARELADKKGYYFYDQYSHNGSKIGHIPTMDHVDRELRRLGEIPTMAFTILGSCSTWYAMREFLAPKWPQLVPIGVASLPGAEEVPGSRSIPRLEELAQIPESIVSEMLTKGTLNFKDVVTNVKKLDVYDFDAELYQVYDMSVGPTAAQLKLSSYRYLEMHWRRFGNFEAFMNQHEKIVLIRFYVDMPLPYFEDQEFLNAFRK